MIAVMERRHYRTLVRYCLATSVCLLGFLASASKGIRDGEWNVLDYAALGDGQTDNTAFFQRVLDEAQRAGGGSVLVPSGQYRLGGGLVIPAGVTLRGSYRRPPLGTYEKGDVAEGTTLLAMGGRGSSDGPPLVRLAGAGAAVMGILITYPEVSADEAPVSYPPSVVIEHSDTAVLDCGILNAYEAIQVRGAGRYLIRNVHGFPARRGIRVEDGREGGCIENCQFSPDGLRSENRGVYAGWVLENGVGFEFSTMEGHSLLNTSCSGYKTGYSFGGSRTGSCAASLVGVRADACARPLLVMQSSDTGLRISNGQFMALGNAKDSACVEVADGCRGSVSLVNCTIGGPATRLMWMRSAMAQLIVSACNLRSWGDEESPAIQIDAGRAIVQGCGLAKGACHVAVGEDANAVTLVGNQAPGGFRVKNAAGARTQVVGNEETGPK